MRFCVATTTVPTYSEVLCSYNGWLYLISPFPNSQRIEIPVSQRISGPIPRVPGNDFILWESGHLFWESDHLSSGIRDILWETGHSILWKSDHLPSGKREILSSGNRKKGNRFLTATTTVLTCSEGWTRYRFHRSQNLYPLYAMLGLKIKFFLLISYFMIRLNFKKIKKSVIYIMLLSDRGTFWSNVIFNDHTTHEPFFNQTALRNHMRIVFEEIFIMMIFDFHNIIRKCILTLNYH